MADLVDPARAAEPALSGGQTARDLAEQFRAHLALRLQLHGADDTGAFLDSILIGAALFLRDCNGHAAVLQTFGAIASEAQQCVALERMPAASEVRQ